MTRTEYRDEIENLINKINRKMLGLPPNSLETHLLASVLMQLDDALESAETYTDFLAQCERQEHQEILDDDGASDPILGGRA